MPTSNYEIFQIIAILLVVFLVIREGICWYFKINKIDGVLHDIFSAIKSIQPKENEYVQERSNRDRMVVEVHDGGGDKKQSLGNQDIAISIDLLKKEIRDLKEKFECLERKNKTGLSGVSHIFNKENEWLGYEYKEIIDENYIFSARYNNEGEFVFSKSNFDDIPESESVEIFTDYMGRVKAKASMQNFKYIREMDFVPIDIQSSLREAKQMRDWLKQKNKVDK